MEMVSVLNINSYDEETKKVLMRMAPQTFTKMVQMVMASPAVLEDIPEEEEEDFSRAEIVMTASKNCVQSIVRIERHNRENIDHGHSQFIGNGPLKGIVIQKTTEDLVATEHPDLHTGFNVCMTNRKAQDSGETWESRELRFWFKKKADKVDQNRSIKQYFKTLIEPERFPRDYTNFIKRAILLVKEHDLVKRIELLMKPITPPEENYLDDIEEEVVVGDTRAPPHVHDVIQEEKLSDDEEEDPPIQNFITVLTPALYDYQYLPEIPVSRKTCLSFRVKAKADAHIALASVYGDIGRRTYEIVIGSSNNTLSVVRDGGQGPVMAEARTPDILDGEDQRWFWIRWVGGILEVGKGLHVGDETFLSWEIPRQMQHSVNCLAVSTGRVSPGEWEFVEYVMADLFEEGSREAKRANYRKILLWLAKKQKMLWVLEDAYPLSMGTAELLRQSKIKPQDMMSAVMSLKELQERGLITELTRGVWIRTPKGRQDTNHDVVIVDQISDIPDKQNATIAIITSLYVEKLAVDVMMEDKVSYVKYKKGETLASAKKDDGESGVYTLGRIGNHSVVATKLPTVSKKFTAFSTGNTVTRLLGAFNKVEHVLLVGVAGGVPNFYDIQYHVRLGDLIIASPNENQGPIYVHCDKVNKLHGSERGKYDYHKLQWPCSSETTQKYLDQMRDIGSNRYGQPPWEKHVEQGLATLLDMEETRFARPPAKSDKLYYLSDENEYFEVEHPKAQPGEEHLNKEGTPRVHYGKIGSGRYLARNEKLRLDFAEKFNILAYDGEFGAVLDAARGNRTDSVVMIRGVSDYSDGLGKKKWQPYASLVAAAYAKALVLTIPAKKRFTSSAKSVPYYTRRR